MSKPTRAKGLGVTDEVYEFMLELQGGHCKLCPGRPGKRRLHVDHDHVSGKVRSLLCHRCNRNLPTWVTPEWLDAAADYLRTDDLWSSPEVSLAAASVEDVA